MTNCRSVQMVLRICSLLLLFTFLHSGVFPQSVSFPLFSAQISQAASIAAQFNEAWREFHALNKDSNKSSKRHYWDTIELQFRSIYRQSPGGSYAPKSLYYLGRVFEELGNRSGLESDFNAAIDYYSRVVSRFPKHSWADDALLRKAKIELNRMNNADAAYADLLKLSHEYSKGDMHKEASSMLRAMDAQSASKVLKTKPAPKKTAGSKSSPKSKTTIAKSATSTIQPARPATKGVLQKVRYRSSNDYTRVVFDLDEEVPYKWQLLKPSKAAKRPHRLYIDLQHSKLSGDILPSISVADGILKQIRTGQYDKDTARVVLDFHDLQDYKVFQLFDPYRVVVDVYAPDNTSKLKQPLPVAKSSDKTGTARASTPSGPLKPSKESKKQVGDLIEQLGLTVNTIMLDPGHGGKDPGAKGNGLLEKNVTLRLAKKVGYRLEKKGFTVIYTRTDDTFIPLEERTAMANLRKADMFVSVHCNAINNRKVHGIETYTLNLARTKDAVRVAARENAVSAKRISDLQVILTDLMLNSKVRESRDLAENVQKNAVGNLSKKYKLRDRHVREAPFYVLMGAKMPAVLIEAGYITNKTEARRLNSNSYLNALADGIVAGIVAYKKRIERFASL